MATSRDKSKLFSDKRTEITEELVDVILKRAKSRASINNIAAASRMSAATLNKWLSDGHAMCDEEQRAIIMKKVPERNHEQWYLKKKLYEEWEALRAESLMDAWEAVLAAGPTKVMDDEEYEVKGDWRATLEFIKRTSTEYPNIDNTVARKTDISIDMNVNLDNIRRKLEAIDTDEYKVLDDTEYEMLDEGYIGVESLDEGTNVDDIPLQADD